MGTIALRGSIMDVFPMGSPSPYRIDWLDDEIDSVHTFDPESQRSTGTVLEIRVLPAREFPLTPAPIERFRGNWRARFEGSPQGSPLYRDVSQALAPPGIEYYLPLCFEVTATSFDYLPADTLIVMDTGVEEAAERFHGEVRERHESHARSSFLLHRLVRSAPSWLLSSRAPASGSADVAYILGKRTMI